MSVPLRYTHRSNVFLFKLVGCSLLVLPLAGGVGTFRVRGGFPFLDGVYIGLGVAVAISVGALVSLRGRSYRDDGDTLVVRGLRWARIDLHTVSEFHAHVWQRQSRRHNTYYYLDVRIEGLRVRFGDSTVPSYFRPDGLRALANVLARSRSRRVRENTTWLRALAEHRDVRSWPERPGYGVAVRRRSRRLR